MSTWGEFAELAPELAAAVRARFEADRHALIATLRRDGSPRISGVEPTIVGDELWIGMMPGSLKSRDLVRDGRFALHSATTSAGMAEGDAKVAGTAEHVTDERVETYLADLFARTGWRPDDLDLFRAELTEAATISVVGEEMVVESWRPGEEVRRRVKRS